MRAVPTLLALAVAAAFGAFAATGLNAVLDHRAEAAPVPAALPIGPALATAGSLPATVGGQALPSLAPMLQQVTPAVVNVYSRQTVRLRSPMGPFADDPVFRRMLGIPNMPRERVQQSLGSGVIVDAKNGYIITNHHVVENADGVSVTLSDGRSVEAEFIGSDPDTDVAVIRIPAKDLVQISLADSSAMNVGDFVVAVGNPFGLGQTVTSGIVSAVGRSGIRGLGYQNFIQTDASINPGNSGGALVNLQGQLVGINTASFNPQGSMAGNIGLGFAIPSNLVRDVFNQIRDHGVVRRGALGIESQTVTPEIARGLGLADARGAVLTRVYAGTGAAKAGLQPGDVIAAVNGQRIDSSDALHNFEGLQPVGSTLKLDVRRAGKPLQLTATLQEQLREIPGEQLDPRLAGATFGELPESARQSGVNGVRVTAVAAGSRAAQNRLRADDVVIAGTSGEFTDLAGFRASFAKRPADLVVRIIRGGSQGDLQLR